MHRSESRIVRLFVVAFRTIAAFCALASMATSQLELGNDAVTLRQIVYGNVLMPDGSAAEGAVVVTSAGDEAVVGADGIFTLEVTLPLTAESLEVTAVLEDGRLGTLSADASIPVTLSPSPMVETLVLAPPSACHSGWVRTFGGAPGRRCMRRAASRLPAASPRRTSRAGTVRAGRRSTPTSRAWPAVHAVRS